MATSFYFGRPLIIWTIITQLDGNVSRIWQPPQGTKKKKKMILLLRRRRGLWYSGPLLTRIKIDICTGIYIELGAAYVLWRPAAQEREAASIPESVGRERSKDSRERGERGMMCARSALYVTQYASSSIAD